MFGEELCNSGYSVEMATTNEESVLRHHQQAGPFGESLQAIFLTDKTANVNDLASE